MYFVDFKLGQHLKDSVTGFEGIAVACTEWLNGCRRISIQPRELKEGKLVEAVAFDIEQLEYVGDGLIKTVHYESDTHINQPLTSTGGPHDDPMRPLDLTSLPTIPR